MVVAAVLLGIAAVLAVVAALALATARPALDRLHFTTLVATPATIAITAAVFVTEGPGQTAFTTLLIGVVLIPTSSIVASATARAVVREMRSGNTRERREPREPRERPQR